MINLTFAATIVALPVISMVILDWALKRAQRRSTLDPFGNDR